MTEGFSIPMPMTITKEVRVYKGPTLPFQQDSFLYFALSPAQMQRDCNGEIAMAVKVFCGPSHEDFTWKRVVEEKMYTNPPHPKSCFYLVAVMLVPIRGSLKCCHCGMRPYKRDYALAYYAVPLNPDVWYDWVCPDCILN